MTWKQIKEIESNDFAIIGHHSHTHEYLIDISNEEFILDIERANKIFLKELGYIPGLFSYPFGEYSKFMRDYISQNFKYAFGQHSGVIDLNKNKFELKDINNIYINRGPGSFAGIRNSISVVKALKLAKNIDYYCYSLEDFKGEKDVKYENVPYLCDKFKIKKNLINPIYIS